MPRDLMVYFRAEARELVSRLGGDTLSLEKEPGPELLARMLRNAHTLKGAARVVQQISIAEATHRFEGLLSPYREAPGPVSSQTINELLACLDEIAAAVEALESPSSELSTEAARPETPSRASPPIASEMGLGFYSGMDVDSLLEDLRAAAGGLETVRHNLGRVERGKALSELLVSQLSGQSGEIRGARFVAEELQSQLRGLERHLGSGVELMQRELRQVQEATERLRLIRADAMAPVLRRALRDACAGSGCQAELMVLGGELRLDPQLIGAVQAALIQAVRNSVAHGLEDAAERASRGKPAQGTVILEVQREGSRVVFRCRDDGRGVDLEAVRRSLQARGAAAAGMSVEQLLRELMRGGVTTARQLTHTAGRGIGLDLIRETADLLGGEADLRTWPDEGTELELSVPWSMTGGEFLETELAGSQDDLPICLLLPLPSVRAALRLHPEAVCTEDGRESIVYEEQAIPLLRLDALLGSSAPEGTSAAVVLSTSGGLMALAVGALRGTRLASLLPLPRWAATSAFVAGATLDAEGQAQLVLDPEGLLLETRSHRQAPAVSPASAPRLLVIDDSLTTRTLQQSILDSAGFMVDLASSAEEGLEKARQEAYDLILVDVEMPGIDGFTFVERIRSDPALRHIPAILVTSRDAPEDRLRGQNVGAQGYMVKSEFDQKELLRLIRGLLT